MSREYREKDETPIQQGIRELANRYDWQYFFTGTYKIQHNKDYAFKHAEQYFNESVEQASSINNPLDYFVFMEGFNNLPKNDLCKWYNEGLGRAIQGRKTLKTRNHIHAVLKFQTDPNIRISKEDPFWMWSKWFKQHGRCQIQKVLFKQDAVRYITKYLTKTIEHDHWGLYVNEPSTDSICV